VGRPWIRIAAIAFAFLLAIGGTIIFAYRAGRAARHIHAAYEPVRPWMSVPFVAHTHHVPEEILFQAIGVEPRAPHDRRSIRRLAHELGRPVPEVIAQLDHAIASEKQRGGAR
jgi:hypothetical protein